MRGKKLPSQPSCAGLPQIGFVFDPLEAAWDQSFEELRLVAEGNGGEAHVSRGDPERPELALWCSRQVRFSFPAR